MAGKLAVKLATTAVAVGAAAAYSVKQMSTYTYTDAQSYQLSGGTIDNFINGIEIDWPYGNVRILETEKDIIEVSEETNSDSEDLRFRYLIDTSGVLKIKYCKSGVYNYFESLKKDLTVSLPKKENYEFVKINTVTSSIGIIGLDTGKLNINTVSGDVYCEVDNSEDTFIKTASGKIVFLTNNTVVFDCMSVSGSVEYESDALADKISAKSATGAIKVYLPYGAVVKADLKSVTGKIDSTFPLVEDGNNIELSLSTVSGNISVAKIVKD